jgi:hypothetical protein
MDKEVGSFSTLLTQTTTSLDLPARQANHAGNRKCVYPSVSHSFTNARSYPYNGLALSSKTGGVPAINPYRYPIKLVYNVPQILLSA